MQQHAAALDMAEEARAEPGPLVRAGDQAGDVGQHEIHLPRAHHAEVRVQRGERVIRDLRPGGGDGSEERRLARVGQPDQPGVGDQLQPKPDRQLLARLAGVGVPRRLVRRALEVRIAEAAVAAAGEPHALTRLPEIGEQGLVVLGVDLGARRHLDDDVGAVRAGAVLAHAGRAVARLEVLLIAVVDQGVEVGDALRPYVAAAPAIAAVRPAELDELLAAEADRAVAAVARADVDLGLGEELHAARALQREASARRRS
jgi:hypothetical protein